MRGTSPVLASRFHLRSARHVPLSETLHRRESQMLAARIAAMVTDSGAWGAARPAVAPLGREVDARSGECLVLSFPLELLCDVFARLDPEDLMRCRLACRLFLRAASHDRCWDRHCEAADERVGPLIFGAPAHDDVWSSMLLYWTRRRQAATWRRETSLAARVAQWSAQP